MSIEINKMLQSGHETSEVVGLQAAARTTTTRKTPAVMCKGFIRRLEDRRGDPATAILGVYVARGIHAKAHFRDLEIQEIGECRVPSLDRRTFEQALAFEQFKRQ